MGTALCRRPGNHSLLRGGTPEKIAEVADWIGEQGTETKRGGGSETAVRARVKAAWQKWRELGPVIADKKIPTKLKTKLYTTVVRPVILYGAECWTTGVKEENILEKTEMRMLRRIKGVTLKDKMKSEDTGIIKELGVGSIKSKARESRLRWFGHVHRREQESNLRQVMDMEVPGRRPRGRLRWRSRLSGGPRHAGTAGGARRCRRQRLLETTDPDRRARSEK
ncbi:endonuclease-reverse transcriptase HmRTE-e01 [Elysia marginata]|uniref:Endonuclease-reverse transcriptase HmRTE-e01 n=1 Tax=Elysia marginata TaxID=1093978 RepID=A0AAV4FLH5_9GAST|nr:endonuclease-reverse transcriptase HmRTE-e01 [Elysia marginata]